MPFRDPNIQSAPETGNAPIRKSNDPFGPQHIPGSAPIRKSNDPFGPQDLTGSAPSSGPLQFPFPPGSIPGPPEGRTLPDQRDAEKYPWPSQSPVEDPSARPAWLDAPAQPGTIPLLEGYPDRQPNPETPRWDFQEPYMAPEPAPQPQPQHPDIDWLDKIPREKIDTLSPEQQKLFQQLFPHKFQVPRRHTSDPPFGPGQIGT